MAGSLKDFTTRITGGGRSGKNYGAVEKLVRGRKIRAQGDIPKSKFNILSGPPKRGSAPKAKRTTLPGMSLKGKRA
jgi:hypothetical protein